MANKFYTLKVEKIVREIPDATSVYFHIPTELKETFSFQAGQYLTVNFEINGEPCRRAYSICTSPLEEDFAVTVKRVEGGRVSNYINDNIEAGSEIEVLPPMGKFTVDIQAENKNDYYLFAGGSGITPMMSILKTVLEKEPNSRVSLLYGSRDQDSIIFEESLKALEKKYASRLSVRHILSIPKLGKAKGIQGWLGQEEVVWRGWTGYLQERRVQDFLIDNMAKGVQQKYLICGPTIMMDMVTESLQNIYVPAEDVMVEFFGTPKKDKNSVNSFSGTAQIKVKLYGEEHNISIDDDTSILDALIKKGANPPFSCSSGACSTCMAKLTKGTVAMDSTFSLDKVDKENGYILTCQSHPTCEVVELDYDAVG